MSTTSTAPLAASAPHTGAPQMGQAARPRRRIRKFLLALGVLVLAGEIGTRLYWWLHTGAPPFSANTMWYAHYPEIRESGVEDGPISNADEVYDVLLLGGSVLSPYFGDVDKRLEEGLRARLGRPVRVFNLCKPAHTSRDSLLKYRSLARQRFDLVVVYNGINDTRMNNCPPEAFRADYTHCTWYRQLQRCEESAFFRSCVLAASLARVGDRVCEALHGEQFLPRSDPPAAWRHFGADIKTRHAFHANLSEIVMTAKTKGERVALMTFAYHVPSDYSLEAFKNKRLDYAKHESPLEVWGEPANVVAGLDAHNDVIRALAAAHPEVVFVDQHARLPKSATHFDDCCHFTKTGCAAFTENLLEALSAAK